MNSTTCGKKSGGEARASRKGKIKACCVKKEELKKGIEKRKKLTEAYTEGRGEQTGEISRIEKEKVRKTKLQLNSIINRLTSHLKICNSFANELEKIEFDKI